RARLEALTAFEIPVGRRGATLERPQTVLVHGETHGATRLTPLEARFLEDPVESLGLGLRLDEPRTRNDHRRYALRHLLSVHDPGCLAQILDATIGAGADDYPVVLDVRDLRAGPAPHIHERTHLTDALLIA